MRSMIVTRIKLATIVAVLLGVSLSYVSGPLQAQLPVPASSQFDLTGFLQAATVTSSADPHSGGTLTVNGHVVTVPAETIVILPASALTWQELFAQSPAPYTGVATGMAQADSPKPLTTYEVHVVGNRVCAAAPCGGASDLYIAGLVDISQQDLNAGAGFINFMDYATGEMRVGGVLNDPNTGARVRINDPANLSSAGGGRYGRAMSPDGRFMVDQDNPTIASATGFPMCFPRVAPPAPGGLETDPLCPQSNRPISTGLAGDTPAGEFLTQFTMTDPALLPLGGAKDPRVQAPFEVGDYVNFAGTLIDDGVGGTYISAHTITNNVAIFTAPNTNPAYVTIEVGLIGTGGLTVFGVGEAAIRTRFEGMTTDAGPTSTRNIHLYGVDVTPVTGATSDRDWGTIGIDPGPPNGAVRGRWRFRPPCTVTVATDKKCTPPPAGTFLPPTREVRAVLETLQGQNPANPAAIPTANGIFYGQYHAPIGEYIFPENIPGNPIPENNFNTLDFLALGGYTSFTGVVAGQLNLWPSNSVPAPVCVSPVASAGGPYTVASGGTVTLAGSSTGTAPLTFAWAAPAQGTLSDPAIAGPVYTAPFVTVDTPVNLSLTATNGCGASTVSAIVTVSAALAPTVDLIAPHTVVSGNSGNFVVTGSDPNVPAATPLTYSVAQSGTVALTSLTVTQNPPTGATVSYTSPSGVSVNTDVFLTITATNTAGLSSSTGTTLTITPAIAACTPPVVTAGGPYSVGFGASVSLAGSSSGTPPITYAWTASAGSFTSGANTLTPVYSAAGVAGGTLVTVTLTGTGCVSQTSSANATITVGSALPPTVNHVGPISVNSGANASFSVSGTDPNVPALTPLTFGVTQNPAGTLLNFLVTQNPPTGATVTFRAPTLPLDQIAPTVVNITVTATNSRALTSPQEFTTVTVIPAPDNVLITSAEYRTGKQRLVITASSSVVSPNVILTLQPYLTATGTTFDPALLGNTFTNNGGGLYTITLVGAPEPAIPPATPLRVRSNLNGISPFHGLDRIRQ